MKRSVVYRFLNLLALALTLTTARAIESAIKDPEISAREMSGSAEGFVLSGDARVVWTNGELSGDRIERKLQLFSASADGTNRVRFYRARINDSGRETMPDTLILSRRLEFESTQNRMTATGDVVVVMNTNQTLRADWIILNTSTRVVRAYMDAPAKRVEFRDTSGARTNAASAVSEAIVRSRRMELIPQSNLMIATGDVEVVINTNQNLQADWMTLDTSSRVVTARGDVRFEGDGWAQRSGAGDRIAMRSRDPSDEFQYDLKQRSGDFGSFRYYQEPYYITADSARTGSNHLEGSGIQFTTCPREHDPHYAIQAAEATIDGDQLRAREVTFRYLDVPFFYTPAFSRRLKQHDRYVEAVPGYQSRHGAFLLSGYHYPVTEDVRGVTRLDYRSKRGWAGGQDFTWRDPSPDALWNGEIAAYYADDLEPFQNERERLKEQDLIDNQRYRIGFRHRERFSDRDYMTAQLDYLGDPDVLEDFFDRDYRNHAQPENRINLIHQGDRYTAGLLLNRRLNDFFGNVDRLPELTIDMQREQLGESGFYYEGDHAAALLSRVYPVGDDEEDYDAFRADSRNMIYYPTRLDALNITPRAGYRATYYSVTRSEVVVTNISIVSSNGVSSVSTSRLERAIEGSSAFRNMPELGLELSIKGYRELIETSEFVLHGRGLRHVIEPYANYTLVPEPDVRPEELPQFDGVDRLDERHDVKIGLRNKLQNKVGKGTVNDLVDADVYSYYRIDLPEGQSNDFSDVVFDIDLNLAERFPISLRGAIDPYEGELSSLDANARWEFGTFFESDPDLRTGRSYLQVGYFTRGDDVDQLSANLSLAPGGPWSFDVYARQDLELGRLEEHGYFISRTVCCLGYGIGVEFEPGYDGNEDDVRGWFRFWVTAFPESVIGTGPGDRR